MLQSIADLSHTMSLSQPCAANRSAPSQMPLRRPLAGSKVQYHADQQPRQLQQRRQQQAPSSQGWGHQRRRGGCDRSCAQAGAADSGSSYQADVTVANKEEQAHLAQPVPEPPPPEEQQQRPQQLWQAMLLSCWALVRSSLWPLLATHAIADGAVFLLHRISHRATNEAAVAFLLGGALTPATIGNMWWLSVDPQLANFQTGYQPLTFVFFLLTFPLVVMVKSWAVLATVLLCQQAQQPDNQEQKSDAAPSWWQPLRGMRHGLTTLRSLSPQIGSLWQRLFLVELLVATAVVPLTFASMAVITIPLTLPIILDLQAAGAAAVMERVSGMAAIKRSQQLMRGVRWQLAVPFVGLVALRRLLEIAKSTLINAMPPRFYQELVEIPLVVLVGGTILSILLARLADVLPFVAFTKASELEVNSSSAAEAADGATPVNPTPA